jgi:hypothetical protein
MRRAGLVSYLLAAVALSGHAQPQQAQQPKPATPAGGGAATGQQLPRIEAAAPPAVSAGKEGAKPRLEYAGKPLRVEFGCKNDDIAAAGLNCSLDEPCPLYLELGSVEAVGNRLFAAGNIHTTGATVASILLASEDGRGWTEPFERIRLGALDQMQFFDFETGWISGQLVVSNTPRDPFFLVTGDGGKTWRRRAVWDESRPGLVETFAFDSRKHGSMAVDRVQSGDDEARYALYESNTGGDSWTIRQASPRPIKLARRSGNTDLRVRADGPSKSYRIERRQGERWLTVGAFLVDVGSCKPEALPVVEPAPPPEEPTATEKPAEQPKPPAKPPTLRKKGG